MKKSRSPLRKATIGLAIGVLIPLLITLYIALIAIVLGLILGIIIAFTGDQSFIVKVIPAVWTTALAISWNRCFVAFSLVFGLAVLLISLTEEKENKKILSTSYTDSTPSTKRKWRLHPDYIGRPEDYYSGKL